MTERQITQQTNSSVAVFVVYLHKLRNFLVVHSAAKQPTKSRLPIFTNTANQTRIATTAKKRKKTQLTQTTASTLSDVSLRVQTREQIVTNAQENQSGSCQTAFAVGVELIEQLSNESANFTPSTSEHPHSEKKTNETKV